jgi:hypothetical protein
LENNYRQYYANIPTIPLPSRSPTQATPSQGPNNTLTPTSSEEYCSKKSKGDANCDNVINDEDFNILKCEFLNNGRCDSLQTNKKSDFNNDGNVNLIDFEIWRFNYYDV